METRAPIFDVMEEDITELDPSDTIFADALRAILHDTALRTQATVPGSAIVHGSTITINSTAYTVIGIQPNGEGSTQLILRKTI